MATASLTCGLTAQDGGHLRAPNLVRVWYTLPSPLPGWSSARIRQRPDDCCNLLHHSDFDCTAVSCVCWMLHFWEMDGWMVQYNCCQPRHLSLITDPTICPPGFNLPRRLRSTLNRFRTGQSRCAANPVRWHQASEPSCICGNPRQTMDHIVNRCPVMRFSGGLWLLHQTDEDAVSRLSTQSRR